MANAGAAMIDVSLLALNGHTPLAIAAFLQARLPGMALFVRFPDRTGISPGEQAWSRHAGITSLLPGSSTAAWQPSLAPVLGRMLEAIGGGAVRMPSLEAWIKETMRTGAEPRPGLVKDAHMDAYQLERAGVKAARLAEAMQAHRERRPGRGSHVARQAVPGVLRRLRGSRLAGGALRAPAPGRPQGVRVPLAHGAHPPRAAPGRVRRRPPLLPLLGAARADRFDRVDLVQAAAAAMPGKGRRAGGRAHLPRQDLPALCFVGEDAARWLMQRFALPLGAAETIGQRLLEKLGRLPPRGRRARLRGEQVLLPLPRGRGNHSRLAQSVNGCARSAIRRRHDRREEGAGARVPDAAGRISALRFMREFHDPAFEKERPALERLRGHRVGRLCAEPQGAAHTHKAGPGFKDPGYDLSGRMARERRAR